MNSNKLYEKDFYGWAYEQASLIRNGDYEHMDIENLIEEIESLGSSQRDKLKSQLRRFFLHKLKIRYQPYLHSRSWDISVKNSLFEINETIEENPSLKPFFNEIFYKAYAGAIRDACKETGLEEGTFPEECPWTPEDLLNPDSIK